MRFLLGTVAALAIGASSAAIAADLPMKARPMVVETYGWNGFYAGLNGGYSWGRSRSDAVFSTPAGTVIVPPAGSITSSDFNLNGGVFGGQIGYNVQTSSFVWGLEADLQWSGEKGSTAFLCASTATGGVCMPGATFLPAGALGTSATLSQSIDWFGTVRGRVGMLVAPSVLAYVTGGLAYASVKSDLGISTTLANVFPAGTLTAAALSSSTTRLGWTFGGGVEAKFARNWSGKLEYLYMDLGTFNSSIGLTPPGIVATVSSRVTDNIFRAGINYHFDAGPVVARYGSIRQDTVKAPGGSPGLLLWGWLGGGSGEAAGPPSPCGLRRANFSAARRSLVGDDGLEPPTSCV